LGNLDGLNKYLKNQAVREFNVHSTLLEIFIV